MNNSNKIRKDFIQCLIDDTNNNKIRWRKSLVSLLGGNQIYKCQWEGIKIKIVNPVNDGIQKFYAVLYVDNIYIDHSYELLTCIENIRYKKNETIIKFKQDQILNKLNQIIIQRFAAEKLNGRIDTIMARLKLNE